MKAHSVLYCVPQRTLNLTLILLVLIGNAVCGEGSPSERDPARRQAIQPDAPLAGAAHSRTSDSKLQAANEPLHGQGLVFIENRGQFDRRVKFLIKSSSGNLWLTNDGIVFDLQRPFANPGTNVADTARVNKLTGPDNKLSLAGMKPEPPKMERLVFKQKFMGAAPNANIEARDPQPGIYNYFTGNDPSKWHTHVLAYKEVVYRDIWKGIDLRLVANGGDMEEEFIVHRGADANEVQLAYEGVEDLALAGDLTDLLYQVDC